MTQLNIHAYYVDSTCGRFHGMEGYHVLYADGRFSLAWKPEVDGVMKPIIRKMQKDGKLRAYSIERIPDKP
jgi:hypothetical protein